MSFKNLTIIWFAVIPRTLWNNVLRSWFHATWFPISSLLYIFPHRTIVSPRGAQRCRMKVCHLFTKLVECLGRMMYLWTLAAQRRWCIRRRMQRTHISTSHTGPVGTNNHAGTFLSLSLSWCLSLFLFTISRLVITCFSDMTGFLFVQWCIFFPLVFFGVGNIKQREG